MINFESELDHHKRQAAKIRQKIEELQSRLEVHDHAITSIRRGVDVPSVGDFVVKNGDKRKTVYRITSVDEVEPGRVFIDGVVHSGYCRSHQSHEKPYLLGYPYEIQVVN